MSGPGPSAPPPEQPPSPPPAAPPPAGPPQAPSMPAWTSQLTSQQAVAGPAGLFYADVPNRIIAYIIDAILVGIVGAIIGIFLFAILGPTTKVETVADPNSLLGVRFETSTNYLSALVFGMSVQAAGGAKRSSLHQNLHISALHHRQAGILEQSRVSRRHGRV